MRTVLLLGGPFDGDFIEISEDLTEVEIPWFRENARPILAKYRMEYTDEFYCAELLDVPVYESNLPSDVEEN